MFAFRFAHPVRLALLIVLGAFGGALAAPVERLALVPLDSRPATRVLPVKIAQLTGVHVRTPDVSLLGTAEHGADQAALRASYNFV